jgi:group II intron reverse transcriptase/maturase
MAYEQVKSKVGYMTTGTDGQTLDGMSMQLIDNLIAELKSEQYQPKPAKRLFIPKSNGKMRPLGIPSTRDKLVQQVVKIILDCIYDSPLGPTFDENSHGFREAKSAHTALKEVQGKWSGTKWFIEGDIKSYFDEIDHEVLINLLKKRICDDRFINLIRKFLNAGYVWEGQFHETEKGTPQGGVISPVLANVYLHEFDLWVQELARSLNKGTRRKASLAYRSLISKRSYLLKKCAGNPSPEQAARVKELESEIRRTPSVDVDDPAFIRVRYVRYADDWLIGLVGPKSLAAEIKEKATAYFNGVLKLELSAEKTKITHCDERASFLGFEIGTPIYKESKLTKYKAVTHEFYTHRRIGGDSLVKLWMPKEEILRRLNTEGFIAFKEGTPYSTSKRSYVHLDPDDIVSRFNAVKRGLFNYYRPARNFGAVMGYVDMLLRYSLAKTLAHKYRTSMKRQFRLRGKSLRVTKEVKGETRTIAYWEASMRKAWRHSRSCRACSARLAGA